MYLLRFNRNCVAFLAVYLESYDGQPCCRFLFNAWTCHKLAHARLYLPASASPRPFSFLSAICLLPCPFTPPRATKSPPTSSTQLSSAVGLAAHLPPRPASRRFCTAACVPPKSHKPRPSTHIARIARGRLAP